MTRLTTKYVWTILIKILFKPSNFCLTSAIVSIPMARQNKLHHSPLSIFNPVQLNYYYYHSIATYKTRCKQIFHICVAIRTFWLWAFAGASIIHTMDINIHYIDLESSARISNGRGFEQCASISGLDFTNDLIHSNDDFIFFFSGIHHIDKIHYACIWWLIIMNDMLNFVWKFKVKQWHNLTFLLIVRSIRILIPIIQNWSFYSRVN